MWGSTIAVVLGGMAVGYTAGGRLADGRPGARTLVGVLLTGAGTLLVVAFAGLRACSPAAPRHSWSAPPPGCCRAPAVAAGSSWPPASPPSLSPRPPCTPPPGPSAGASVRASRPESCPYRSSTRPDPAAGVPRRSRPVRAGRPQPWQAAARLHARDPRRGLPCATARAGAADRRRRRLTRPLPSSGRALRARRRRRAPPAGARPRPPLVRPPGRTLGRLPRRRRPPVPHPQR